MPYIGYVAWNRGSEYGEVRTGGNPPSIAMYLWFCRLRRHRTASNASPRWRVVLATARFKPPMVTLAGCPATTAG